jgi:hypothetical protein
VVAGGVAVFGVPLPRPLLHAYVNAPAAVSVDDAPLHMVAGVAAAVTVGKIKGAAVPLPGALVHPYTEVCVTVLVPALVTVIEEVVSDVFHNNVPV